MSVWDQVAGLIQKQEGFFPGSRAWRNNNPGNLRPNGMMFAGQTGVDPDGFAIFPDYQTGYNALITDLQTHFNRNPGQTLADFIHSYASSSPADQQASYIAALASGLGVSADTPLSQIQAAGGSIAPPPLPGAVPPQSTAGPDVAMVIAAAAGAMGLSLLLFG